MHRPLLTTMRQPLHQMGVLAANAVLHELTAPETHTTAVEVVVEPELVVRATTGAPAVYTAAAAA